MLLWWNRSTRMARFALHRSRARSGCTPTCPAAAVDERELDRLLGLVVEGAVAVREFQRRPASGLQRGWRAGRSLNAR